MQSIKAILPSGQTEITINGLHQWDYGRKLEIHSNDISAGVLIEVHFACAGMDTAVVRVSNIVSGVATVTIPDKCLEQTTPVVAWVFEIDDTNKSGVTTKRINMPVEARPRPSVSEDIPQEVSDKYTEALTAINEAVADLKNGVVKVSNASHADEANKATLDGNGQTITSTYAKKTDLTSGTITVAKATKDGNGNTIASTYAKKTDLTSGAITVAKASALVTDEIFIDEITSAGVAVALEYGRVYFISARFDGQAEFYRFTYVLYVANKGENFPSDATSITSAPDRNGCCAWWNGSVLKFPNYTTQVTSTARDVTIRKI